MSSSRKRPYAKIPGFNEANTPRALEQLGKKYIAQKDYTAAFACFKKAAQQDASCYYRVGDMYMNGWGVAKNPHIGLSLIQAAAIHSKQKKDTLYGYDLIIDRIKEYALDKKSVLFYAANMALYRIYYVTNQNDQEKNQVDFILSQPRKSPWQAYQTYIKGTQARDNKNQHEAISAYHEVIMKAENAELQVLALFAVAEIHAHSEGDETIDLAIAEFRLAYQQAKQSPAGRQSAIVFLTRLEKNLENKAEALRAEISQAKTAQEKSAAEQAYQSLMNNKNNCLRVIAECYQQDAEFEYEIGDSELARSRLIDAIKYYETLQDDRAKKTASYRLAEIDAEDNLSASVALDLLTKLPQTSGYEDEKFKQAMYQIAEAEEKENPTKSFELFAKLAEKNHLNAQIKYADALLNARLGQPVQLAKALAQFEQTLNQAILTDNVPVVQKAVECLATFRKAFPNAKIDKLFADVLTFLYTQDVLKVKPILNLLANTVNLAIQKSAKFMLDERARRKELDFVRAEVIRLYANYDRLGLKKLSEKEKKILAEMDAFKKQVEQAKAWLQEKRKPIGSVEAPLYPNLHGKDEAKISDESKSVAQDNNQHQVLDEKSIPVDTLPVVPVPAPDVNLISVAPPSIPVVPVDDEVFEVQYAVEETFSTDDVLQPLHVPNNPVIASEARQSSAADYVSLQVEGMSSASSARSEEGLSRRAYHVTEEQQRFAAVEFARLELELQGEEPGNEQHSAKSEEKTDYRKSAAVSRQIGLHSPKRQVPSPVKDVDSDLELDDENQRVVLYS